MDNTLVGAERQRLTYETYLSLRQKGFSPLAVGFKWTEMASQPSEFSVKGLVSIVIGIVSFVVIDKAIRSLTGKWFDGESLWITSPSGETTMEMPFYRALRIVRKQEWSFAEVEPVKPKRVVGRAEALKIMFRGDK